MPKKDHYVIIGNGPAGNSAADTLRENDTEARISIISDETFSFYYRHKLMDFTCSMKDEEALKARPYSVYKQKNIRMRLGQKVERIDTDNNILYLKHMEKVGFTKLILATGGKPRVLPELSGLRDYFTFMSSYNDAVSLRHAIQKANHIIIFGGDIISISYIKALRAIGKEITFLLFDKCFWPFDLTADIITAITKKMAAMNVNVILNPTIQSFTPKGASHFLNIADNDPVTGDLIFCSMGLTPNIRFIVGSGIDNEQGVLVNEFLQTNKKDIYACGDCAQIYNPTLKNYWTSIGWENARLQGETSALNLLGYHKVISPAPKNILNVEGIKIRTQWWKEL